MRNNHSQLSMATRENLVNSFDVHIHIYILNCLFCLKFIQTSELQRVAVFYAHGESPSSKVFIDGSKYFKQA